MNRPSVTAALNKHGWFKRPGAYVLVDGQFGSTGKGLLAGVLAIHGAGAITHCTTNAGPNSGHTAYLSPIDYDWEEGAKEKKIVTQQVPVASAFLSLMGYANKTLINAGAIIDVEQLGREVTEWLTPREVFIHPNAAVISTDDIKADKAVVARIAGTGKGTGPALQAKIGRDIKAVAHTVFGLQLPPRAEGEKDRTWDDFWDWTRDVVFVETAQGFSLGLNSKFYPNVTSRECTVMQALADARIPAQMLNKVVACFRTFPIRVGNSPEGGYSGDYYPDQKEITFADIGQPEELTTVTKRVRRLFTWSRVQFRECVAANRPDMVFINFMNYLPLDQHQEFLDLMVLDYVSVMGRKPEAVLLGFGPRSEDVTAWDGI